jgi:hypothetical protein
MFDSNPTVCRPAKSSLAQLGLREFVCGFSRFLILAIVAFPSFVHAQQAPNAPDTQQQQSQPSSPSEQPDATAPPSQPAPPPKASVPPAIEEQVVQNPNAPCVQPPPPVTWEDYQGPFAKTVAIFAQRLERRSVGPGSQPQHHYKPGVLLCTLETRDKFWLFVRDSTDPVAFLGAGWNAGVSQVEDTQPTFGRGFTGYLDRFGAQMAGQTSGNFFKDFLYPTIFSEDPRYYRLGTGSTKRRVIHAASHVVIAHNENGNKMFNFSEWLGDATVRVLTNTYLPDSRRGVGPVASSMADGMLDDMGYDILREFWPEIAKKFHLPFREQNEPPVITMPVNP